MADELLSIEESTLNAIAQAIKNKGGTSAALSFPNGMVSALQAIETEATVTPKIAPQQKVLTPSETQFVIDAGFHDGTGTVAIQFDNTNNSANPTSTQQTYYPSSGKFFSSFYVGGLGNGTQVVTGTATLNDSENFVVENLGFTPSGMIVFFLPSNPSASDYTERMGGVFKVPDTSPQYAGYSYTSTGSSTASNSFTFDFRQGRASVDSPVTNWKGTYFYMVMG